MFKNLPQNSFRSNPCMANHTERNTKSTRLPLFYDPFHVRNIDDNSVSEYTSQLNIAC